MLRPAALLLCAAFATGFAAEGAKALPSDDQIAAAIAQAQDTLAQGRPTSLAIGGQLFSIANAPGGRIALVPAYGDAIQLTTVTANGVLTITEITINGQKRAVQLVVSGKNAKKKTGDELLGGNDIAGGDAGGGLAAGANGAGAVASPINAQPPASPR